MTETHYRLAADGIEVVFDPGSGMLRELAVTRGERGPVEALVLRVLVELHPHDARDFLELLDKRNGIEALTVERDGHAALELDLDLGERQRLVERAGR